MGSRIGKNGGFGVHFGANWRLKTSSFLPFSKTRSFIFNKMVASLVSKNNLFPFLLSFPSGRPFVFPPVRRLVPNPSREWQTIIGYHGGVGMSSEKWQILPLFPAAISPGVIRPPVRRWARCKHEMHSIKEAGFEFLIRLECWEGLFPTVILQALVIERR
jgi:hypothetical protein